MSHSSPKRPRLHSTPPQADAQTPVEEVDESDTTPLIPSDVERPTMLNTWQETVLNKVYSKFLKHPDGKVQQLLPNAIRKFVVRREDSKIPATLSSAKDSDDFVIYKDDSLMTHLASLFISETRCFLVSAFKVIGHGTHRSKLGICVFAKASSCNDPQCKKCEDCGVCPHMYICHNCQLKFRDSDWCAHIHKMHSLTKGKFAGAAIMFVHQDWQFKELYHLRAFVQGKTKMMEKSKDFIWKEQFELLKRKPRHRVYQLSSPESCTCSDDEKCKLCKACICVYACTCDSFLDEQICEHIHNVAMQQDKALFDSFSGIEADSEHKLEPGENLNCKLYIEEQHQMSFYFDLKDITQDGTEWQVKCKRKGKDVPEYFIVSKRPTTDDPCHREENIGVEANCCERCKICHEDYTCSCTSIKFTICQHIHAVIRWIQWTSFKTTETPDQMHHYIKSSLKQEGKPKGETRQPIKLIEDRRFSDEQLAIILSEFSIDSESKPSSSESKPSSSKSKPSS